MAATYVKAAAWRTCLLGNLFSRINSRRIPSIKQSPSYWHWNSTGIVIVWNKTANKNAAIPADISRAPSHHQKIKPDEEGEGSAVNQNLPGERSRLQDAERKYPLLCLHSIAGLMGSNAKREAKGVAVIHLRRKPDNAAIRGS